MDELGEITSYSPNRCCVRSIAGPFPPMVMEALACTVTIGKATANVVDTEQRLIGCSPPLRKTRAVQQLTPVQFNGCGELKEAG